MSLLILAELNSWIPDTLWYFMNISKPFGYNFEFILKWLFIGRLTLAELLLNLNIAKILNMNPWHKCVFISVLTNEFHDVHNTRSFLISMIDLRLKISDSIGWLVIQLNSHFQWRMILIWLMETLNKQA